MGQFYEGNQNMKPTEKKSKKGQIIKKEEGREAYLGRN
jgi:hypothetical protein